MTFRVFFSMTLGWLERFARFGVLVSFLVTIAAVIIQVVGRKIGYSPVWTEELTRFALLYIAAFGVGGAYLTGDLVNVDVFYNLFPPGVIRALKIFSAAVTCIFCGFLIMPAWQYTSIGALQYSPALEWRMDFIHFSIVLLLSSLCLFSLTNVFKLLTEKA